jgi:hypothetical protein
MFTGKLRSGRPANASRPLLNLPVSAAQRPPVFSTIAPVVKSARLTEPMLMYQHSRSDAFGVGRSQKLESPVCTLVLCH